MELPDFMKSDSHRVEVKTVDMHTCGEPTRIVFDGFPDMTGTLLEQREEAKKYYDRIREALVQEPRGHPEMYGAVLLPNTELTGKVPRVDLGALFLTNEGYSTMCGHATLAIGRLLADHVGSRSYQLLPQVQLEDLERDLEEKKEVYIHIHVPCGVVDITVPVVPLETFGALPRWKTDTNRPTSYLSVPSFATGISVPIKIPLASTNVMRWAELKDREEVTVDIAYGGAFYVIVSLHQLGFNPHCLSLPGMLMLPKLKEAVQCLRTLCLLGEANKIVGERYLRHPERPGQQELYGVIVTGFSPREYRSDALGLCIFANSQVDRSPTGSGVQARVALAWEKRELRLKEPRTYHSPVSNALYGDDAFVGEAVEEVKTNSGCSAVVVKVSGFARYTGCSTFLVEENDPIGEGFVFDSLSSPR